MEGFPWGDLRKIFIEWKVIAKHIPTFTPIFVHLSAYLCAEAKASYRVLQENHQEMR